MNSLNPASARLFSAAATPGRKRHVFDAAQIILFLNQHAVTVEKYSRFHFGKLWFDYGKNGIEFFPLPGILLRLRFLTINEPIK